MNSSMFSQREATVRRIKKFSSATEIPPTNLRLQNTVHHGSVLSGLQSADFIVATDDPPKNVRSALENSLLCFLPYLSYAPYLSSFSITVFGSVKNEIRSIQTKSKANSTIILCWVSHYQFLFSRGSDGPYDHGRVRRGAWRLHRDRHFHRLAETHQKHRQNQQNRGKDCKRNRPNKSTVLLICFTLTVLH